MDEELWPNQVYEDIYGELVKLDRRVPGDGTKWYVADWDERMSSWYYMDGTIEPGDLVRRRKDLE